jgi:tetratricopeptide (TPR) repeat protein
MIRRRFFLGLWFIWVFISPAYAQHYGEASPQGDAAAAEKYVQWAEKALDEGRRKEAREVLERAADFADVSSDLSYLLARTRFHEGAPKGAVLEALRRGLEADRWYAYPADAARLLEAEILIGLRSFSEALRILNSIPSGADEICLRLSAFKGLGDREGFRRTMVLALEQYPRDPRPVRLLFEFFRSGPPQGSYAPEPYPGETERTLINTALRRLPLLAEADGELAYLAVPFIAGLDEARRYTAAYRALGDPNPASLPAALMLGLIDEYQALEELFSPKFLISSQTPGTLTLDRALLLSLWALLRTPESRDRFSRNLSAFSGVIMDDGDRDGYPEAWTVFSGGLPESYSYDPDQDGLAELVISFSQGAPEQGVLVLASGPQAGGEEIFAYPVKDEDRVRAVVRWEQYPAVGIVFLEGVSYVPRPFEFFYSPIRFIDLLGSSLRYPEGDLRAIRITRQTLGSFSLYVERPGRNADKARERVTLDRGIPQRAVEFLGDQVVSEIEFKLGRPVVQRVDLDLDGRMETIRRFREDPSPFPGGYVFSDYLRGLESSQSDWDGDGVFETGEAYFPDGTLKSNWNLNRDGVR